MGTPALRHSDLSHMQRKAGVQSLSLSHTHTYTQRHEDRLWPGNSCHKCSPGDLSTISAPGPQKTPLSVQETLIPSLRLEEFDPQMRLFSAIMPPLAQPQRISGIRVEQGLSITCSAPPILQGRHKSPKRTQPAKVPGVGHSSATVHIRVLSHLKTWPFSQRGSLTEKSSSEELGRTPIPLASILWGVLGAVLLFLSRQFSSASKLMSCQAALMNRHKVHAISTVVV